MLAKTRLEEGHHTLQITNLMDKETKYKDVLVEISSTQVVGLNVY